MIPDLGTILGVWAHPDDEGYLSAGIMADAVRNGRRVVCVTATRGEAADPGRWPPAELAQIREVEIANMPRRSSASPITAGSTIPTVAAPRSTPTRRGTRIVGDHRRGATRHRAHVRPRRQTGHPDHIAVSDWTDAARRASAPPTPSLYFATNSAEWADTLRGKPPIDMGVMMGAESTAAHARDRARDPRRCSTASSSTSRSGPCARRRRRSTTCATPWVTSSTARSCAKKRSAAPERRRNVDVVDSWRASASRSRRAPSRLRALPAAPARASPRCGRAAGSGRASAGNHQLRSPSSSIVAGTSTMRTIVASMSTATARPSPNSFSDRSSPSTNAENTHTMIERGRGDHACGGGETVGDGGRVVVGAVVLLLHAGQEEHLVVHREAEHDREQHHRRPRLDRALRDRRR